MREGGLHTVCEEARCPNIGECWGRGTATFQIMGDVCTRACRYCAVTSGRPETAPEPLEPLRVARAVQRMGLRHVVVTSVDRDDLPDRGAGHFAATIRAIRRASPDCGIEVLVPDFLGFREEALVTVLEAAPDVFNHNIETAEHLYRRVRPKGDYRQALDLLDRAKDVWASAAPGAAAAPDQVRHHRRHGRDRRRRRRRSCATCARTGSTWSRSGSTCSRPSATCRSTAG